MEYELRLQVLTENTKKIYTLGNFISLRWGDLSDKVDAVILTKSKSS